MSTPPPFPPRVATVSHGTYTADSQSFSGQQAELIAVSTSGSTCVEYMIIHQHEVFHSTRNDLAIKQNHLATKCSRIIRALQETLSQIVYIPQDVSSPSELDVEQVKLIYELFALLEPAERMLSFTPTATKEGIHSSESGTFLGLTAIDELGSISPRVESKQTVPIVRLPVSLQKTAHRDSNDELDDILFGSNSNDDGSPRGEAESECSVRSVHALLNHPRWSVCGFQSVDSESGSALRDFSSMYGFVALQCLVGFLRRFEDKGAAIIRDFVEQRRNYCTLSKVVLRLVHFTADVLQLLPPPQSSALSLIQRLSMHPAWVLLNEENCFQDFFDVALLSFDDAWRQSCDRVQQLPCGETYSEALFACRKTLWEVMGKRPKTSNAMWEVWMQNRLQEQERLCAATAQLAAPVAAVVAHSNAARDQIESQFVSPPEERVSAPRVVIASVAVSGAKSGSPVVTGTVVQSKPVLKAEVILATPPPATSTSSDINPSANSSASAKSPPIIIGASAKRNSLSKPAAVSSATSPSTTTSSSSSILPASYSAQYDVNEHNAECVLDGTLGIDKNATPSHHSSLFTSEAAWSHVDASRDAMLTTLSKSCSGIDSSVFGGSEILTERHIHQLEAALPQSYQCYDWRLLYRLSVHGASLVTLLTRAQGVPNSLLVVRDAKGAVFGALITEYLKINEKEKYYGNGTIGVWSFASGALRFYPWAFRNSYFLLSSREAVALGGGGNFAIYMDGDLNKGSSGPCATFSSPCLASAEQFVVSTVELYALENIKG